MNIQNLLNQFMGVTNVADTGNTAQGISGTLNKLTRNIPGGLAGGAAAGGIMALLMSNKSARKFATTAATYGGAALLGGLAYNAYKNWQQGNRDQATHSVSPQHDSTMENGFAANDALTSDFELKLIKAMIAAAKSDGHIDTYEQQRIFKTLEQMELSTEMKAMMFDLLNQTISVEELAHGVDDMTLKSELYLASCLVISPDHPLEQAHLDKLAQALELPPSLVAQLQMQASQAINEAA